MDAWIECVPNISEGRRKDVIDTVVETLKGRAGVHLLDVESDADHNRTVVTFVARPEVLVETAVAFCRRAVELIDLNEHEGQHPRMGAVDVFPLTPVAGVTRAECIALCHEIGRALGDELSLPTYLYEDAATRPDRKNLARVRKSGPLEEGGERVGAFEWLRVNVPALPARKPDYGPNAAHATAGFTGISTRFFLIAYNVNLVSTDLELAQRVAEGIRQRSGGFMAVKALGFELKEQNCVQVSMNLVDYTKTGIDIVYKRIRDLAREWGDVEVKESEVVGLIPQDAINRAFIGFAKLPANERLAITDAEDAVPTYVVKLATGQTIERDVTPDKDVAAMFKKISAEAAMAGSAIASARLVGPIRQAAVNKAFCTFIHLPRLEEGQILEEIVRKATGGAPHGTIEPEEPVELMRPFLGTLASASPTPGGGSAAAVAGALAGCLGQMVANLTIGKKKYVDVEAQALELRDRLAEQTEVLHAAIEQDSLAYDGVALARKRPKATEDQQAARLVAIQEATVIAADVPLTIAERACDVLEALVELVAIGNTSAITDCGVAALLANVCVQGATMNTRINLLDLEDEAKKAELVARVDAALARCKQRRDAVMKRVEAILRGED